MEREKQIEEMHLDFEKWDDTDTELSLAEWMYNLGYRKASELAEEIFEEVEEIRRAHHWDEISRWDVIVRLNRLKEKYGVKAK